MRRYLPRLGVVYMTGCADEQGTASLPCGPRDLLLAKPFAVEDLRKKIAALVGGEEGEE
jgi:hypothetical protein